MFIRNAITQLLLLLCASCAVAWWLPTCGLGQDANTKSDAGRTNTTSPSPALKQTRIRFINISQAEVLAGPAESFYPTCILQSGQAIEVHQQTDDGWLAITPPPGSFSWLPASQGLLLPGGRIVEVTEKSAVSWIGTSLGTAKQYCWQVKLERGQQLAVIGERSINDAASGSQALWYKIAPPPGEYRWIQSKATSETQPTVSAPSDSLETPSIASDESDPATEASSQVVQAAATQPTSIVNGKRPQSKPAKRAAPHQHVDRWDEWHAVEFKNGTFSFPGLSRTLGMQPTESSNAQSTSDPFDLTANYARPSSSRAVAPLGQPGTSDVNASDSLPHDATSSHMAARQSRGWRDPRQLREDRQRGGLVETPSSETALAANEPSIGDDEVMDATYLEDTAVGTSVITAGATAPRRLSSLVQSMIQGQDEQSLDHDQAWYGIDQAPTSQVANAAPAAGAQAIAAQSNLDALQLELSAMVAGPEHTWNLAPLAARAQYFVEHGRDSLERGQARLLLERIESFSAVAKQSSVLGRPQPLAPTQAIPASAVATSTGTSVSAASWVAPSSSNAAAGTEPGGAKFDATGWLVPVHSNGRDMPTHALTNDAGRIIVYVTPAPGVNLSRFESQAIGVYGLRGYLPQLKSNHIQIQRVVRLQ